MNTATALTPTNWRSWLGRLIRIVQTKFAGVGTDLLNYYTSDMQSTGQKGICGECGKGPSAEGHDGCLGTLPGPIMNACCGHGCVDAAYIQFENGQRVAGQEAIDLSQRLLGRPEVGRITTRRRPEIP